MGRLEKYFFGEAGVKNLIQGMILIFIALGLILFAYGGVLGKPAGEEIVIAMTPEQYASTMLLIWLAILFFGVWGGFEIGRYVQTEFTKKRLAKQVPPPPP